MFWFMYNVLFSIGYVLMMPRFLYRMWRRGGYRKGFSERFGLYPPAKREAMSARRRIWIHAVSVGEVLVALRFMAEMRAARPETAFVMSTTTSTGHKLAQGRMDPQDVLIYFPSDFPWIVRRVLNAIRPEALILTESEIWPNLVRLAAGRRIPVMVINGRISEPSYRGYRRIRMFVKPVLQSFDRFLVQSEADSRRLVDLGAPADRVRVMGTAKYDVARSDEQAVERARRVMDLAGIGPERQVLLGGSTWPGEEGVLLDIYRSLADRFPGLALVLVPRHAERRDEVEAEIRKRGLRWARRSGLNGAGRSETPSPVLLVDTTGELSDLYNCASVIFVGKSLLHQGGQNIIEPALCGKPIIVGPHMENFVDVMADFRAAGAIREVADAAGLESAVGGLLADPAQCAESGRRAQAVVEGSRGVVAASVRLVVERLALQPR